MKRLLREPLLHFLLLGAALFVAYGYLEPRVGRTDASKQILLTQDELLQLANNFQFQWRRSPTPEEFGRLLDDKVRQEVLYREALAMGLDRDDEIVKRRMAQKMKFLAEDVASAREPTRAELEAWYAKNPDKFRLPGRISFRQLYFSPDKRGGVARDDAEKALTMLAGQPVDAKVAAGLGDSIMLQGYSSERSPEQVGKEFGPAFSQALFRVDPGAWRGPLESGFGWHVVFVDSSAPGRTPAFAEVEPEVKTAWLGEQKAIAWEKAYKEMRARYTVLVPAIPETAVRAEGELSRGAGSTPVGKP